MTEDECQFVSGTTSSSCHLKARNVGTYKIVAKTTDTKGRRVHSSINAWVVGPDRIVWEGSENNHVEIIPESNKLAVGDTARFLIKNPFKETKALITVERYGILNQFVKTFKTSTPIIEIPITKDHLPGFYLSVVLTSPRVQGPVVLISWIWGNPL